MMDPDGKIDPTFFSTCRLCVSTPGSYQILPQVQLQIKELFDIKVDAYDGLPQLLCNECRGIVTKLHIIRCDFQKKQRELVLRTKGHRAAEDVQISPEEKGENTVGLQNLNFSKLPAVTLLDISKVSQKFSMEPSSESERAAFTPPIVTTTNVDLTFAECDTSSAEPPQSQISDSTNHNCSKDDDSHHNADDTNADNNNAYDDHPYDGIRQLDFFGPPPSVCSSSKSSPKKWRRLYVCKFCNRRFTRVNDVRFHLSIHNNLMELQSDLRIKPCFVAMNLSDETDARNTSINLREDSKVENSFEHFYVLNLYLDTDEYKGVINDSDVVRNLRLKRQYYAETDSEDDTSSKSPKIKLSKPRKLSSSSLSTSGLISDETELRNSSIKSADVPNRQKKKSELFEHKKHIMSMVRQAFSKALDEKKQKTSDLLKSDETAIEYLLNGGDGIINVLWTNSMKSQHAEFVISTRSFAPRSGGFYPPRRRPDDFIDLSLMLRNTGPPPPPPNMLEITPMEPSTSHMQPCIIQLNQQESNQQPIQSKNITVASINFDTEMNDQTVSPPLVLNQTSAAAEGLNLNIIDVRSLRTNDVVYISDDEKTDAIRPTVMPATSEQMPRNIETTPLTVMGSAFKPIILNTKSLAVAPPPLPPQLPTPPRPEANFDVPILSNIVIDKLKTYTAKRKPPLETQIKVETLNVSLAQVLQRPSAPMGAKPLPELIPQRSFIKCKPTSLLLSGGSMSNESPPPPESSKLIALADFRAALNARGFQLVEDTKSNEFTTLARYNINMLKTTHKVSLTVSLFVCQSNSTVFCIQVTDSRGRIAVESEPVFNQSQIIKSLLDSQVVKIVMNNAKALSSHAVFNNASKFIHIGRMLAGSNSQ